MQNLNNGLYVIVDPQMDSGLLVRQLKAALQEPLSAIQIWDNFAPGTDPGDLVRLVLETVGQNQVPVLINNHWSLLKDHALAGVHFDVLPDMGSIRKTLGREFISGLTCTNDLEHIRQAEIQKINYISFCSLFPSSTANSCTLVDFNSVKAAAKLFSGKVFLSGGIRPENAHQLTDLPYHGLAVVSGIMQASDPKAAIQRYSAYLNNES